MLTYLVVALCLQREVIPEGDEDHAAGEEIEVESDDVGTSLPEELPLSNDENASVASGICPPNGRLTRSKSSMSNKSEDSVEETGLRLPTATPLSAVNTNIASN